MEDENQGGLSEESRRRVEQILGQEIPKEQLVKTQEHGSGENESSGPSIKVIILVILIILIFIIGAVFGYFHLLEKTKSVLQFS